MAEASSAVRQSLVENGHQKQDQKGHHTTLGYVILGHAAAEID
jgi:hypothetical protein